MAIVASESIVGHLQRDGRRYVREVHTDHLGAVHDRWGALMLDRGE